MNHHDEGPLAQRLADLTLPMPKTLTLRVLSRASASQGLRHPRRPIWATATLAVCVLLAGSIAGSYFAPRFGAALADSPVLGSALKPVLEGMGLDPLAARFQQVNAVSTSAGYRLQIMAAYADQNETYLAVRMSPALAAFPRDFPGDATLTDQFGRTLAFRGGSSDDRTGTGLWNFAGLAWPDNAVGARLTLHVRALEVASQQPRTIQGDWTLHLTVGIEPSQPYTGPTPADGQLGQSTVHFTQVQAGAATIRIQMQIGEPLSKTLGDTIGSEVPGVSKPHLAFQVRLVRADGTDVQALESGQQSSLTGTDVTTSWLRPAPGKYRLIVSYEGIGQIERQLDLP